MTTMLFYVWRDLCHDFNEISEKDHAKRVGHGENLYKAMKNIHDENYEQILEDVNHYHMQLLLGEDDD